MHARTKKESTKQWNMFKRDKNSHPCPPPLIHKRVVFFCVLVSINGTDLTKLRFICKENFKSLLLFIKSRLDLFSSNKKGLKEL